MKNHKYILIIFLSLLGFISCSSISEQDDYYDITKKTTNDSFLKEKEDNIVKSIEITSSNQKYIVHFGKVVSKLVSYRTSNNYGGSFAGSSHSTQNSATTQYYFFAFKNSFFFYGGYLYEFLRNEDKAIKTLGEDLFKYLEKEED